MMKPELPGAQTSPVGLVVAKSTVPVSGGWVEFDKTRSPPVNAIFQPFLLVKMGAVQFLTE